MKGGTGVTRSGKKTRLHRPASPGYRRILRKAYADPKCAGKHLRIPGDTIYAARAGREASRILARIMRTRPGRMPLRVDIPAADTLVLWLDG